MKQLSRAALLLTTALVFVPTLACSKVKEKIAEKAAEKVLEKATGADDVDLNSSSGGVTIKNAKGDVMQTGQGTKLPDGWPSDVPVYPGSTVISAVSSPKTKLVHLQTKAEPDDVIQFYKGKLPGEKTHEVSMGQGRGATFKDGDRTINVFVGGDDGKQAKGAPVELTVNEK